MLIATIWVGLLPLLAQDQPQEPAKSERCTYCNDTGLMTCPTCNGDYQDVQKTVECRAQGGTGCAGRGYRQCFTCKGRGSSSCKNCKGTGQVARTERRRDARDRRVQDQRTETCNICDGRGLEECRNCRELYVRESTDPNLPPMISEGQPLGPSVTRVVGWDGRSYTVTDHYSAWTRHEGMIVCPKCNGKGRIVLKGRCPDCDKGKTPCLYCAKGQERQAAAPVIETSKCPVRLIHVHELKQALAALPPEEKARIEALMDEYLRLRNALQEIVEGCDQPQSTAADAAQKSDDKLKEAGFK